MAFPEGTPTVTLTLAGSPRVLGFTIGAMRRAQELGVLEVDTADEMALTLALPSYVWACMDKEDREEISFDDVADLINPSNLAHVRDSVSALFNASQPDEPEGNAPPAAAKKPSGSKRTSPDSGRSASTTSALRTIPSGASL